MIALSLAADNRILSACKVLSNGKYNGMPIVESLPDGNLPDYRYENDEYIYDPLPEPEQPAPTPTDSERITDLEDTITALIGGISDAV